MNLIQDEPDETNHLVGPTPDAPGAGGVGPEPAPAVGEPDPDVDAGTDGETAPDTTPATDTEPADGDDGEGDEDGSDADGEAAEDDKAAGKKRKRGRSTLEWVAVIGGALLVALIVRTFFIQAFWIPSESMEPTLHKGDRVLVNKLSYKLHDVHRGDVIVFERPEGSSAGEEGINDLIKRVVGLPGETIETVDGHIEIDGKPLDEPYLPENQPPGPDVQRTVIPKDEYFVMGDNRDESADSRFFGPIDEGLIVGRAFVLFWPLNDIGWL
jgi:signal peptidase I